MPYFSTWILLWLQRLVSPAKMCGFYVCLLVKVMIVCRYAGPVKSGIIPSLSFYMLTVASTNSSINDEYKTNSSKR